MTANTLVEHRAHTVVDSPVGPLTLMAVEGTLAGLYMQQQRHRPAPETFGEPDATLFDAALHQLREYFAGQRTRFDLPMALHGTPFQKSIGTSATHGCIRMHDDDIEWLYNNVPVGTKVYLY